MAIIAEFVMQLHDDGTVTVSGFQSEPAQAAAAVQAVQAAVPGSQVVEDPWAGVPGNPQPAPQQQPAQPVYGTPPAPIGTPPQAQPQSAPACVHGPLKVVPGGFSQAKQKAYAAFWACPAPRGQQCRLDSKQLPPIPA